MALCISTRFASCQPTSLFCKSSFDTLYCSVCMRIVVGWLDRTCGRVTRFKLAVPHFYLGKSNHRDPPGSSADQKKKDCGPDFIVTFYTCLCVCHISSTASRTRPKSRLHQVLLLRSLRRPHWYYPLGSIAGFIRSLLCSRLDQPKFLTATCKNSNLRSLMTNNSTTSRFVGRKREKNREEWDTHTVA